MTISTPVYRDNFFNLAQHTFGDRAFRGDYDMSNNLIYAGFALPGASEGDRVWQIKKLTYTGTNLTSITWPQLNSKANHTNSFSWTDRTTYTYS
jgi:hypothetical protein